MANYNQSVKVWIAGTEVGATPVWIEGANALDSKASVRVATTANITIATALNDGDTIDGITLATGDRVLVKDQSTASQNGIYDVGATPTRSADFNAWDQIPGALVAVEVGTTNADTVWLCSADQGGTLDTTSITFTQFGVDQTARETATAAETAAGLATFAIKTGAFDAEVGGNYLARGTFTITDPSGTTAGQTYRVIVASGSVTIGGTAYAPSRWPVVREYNGSAWATLANTLTDNLTANGTNNTAPNQTAAGGSSVMTRSLGDARWNLRTVASYISSTSAAVNNSTTLADSGVAVTLPAGVYRLSANFLITGPAGAGHKYAFTIVSGTVSYAGGTRSRFTSGGSHVAIASQASLAGLGVATTGDSIITHVDAILSVSADAVIKLQFAQNSAVVGDTTVGSGGYMVCIPLP